MNDELMLEWFETQVQDIPMEQFRAVLVAIVKHLNLKLEQKNWYAADPEFRVSTKTPNK